MAAGIDIDLHVDMELLQARMKNLGANMKDFSVPGRKAAEIVNNERKATVPYITGHFAKAGYVRATNRHSYVGLRHTGGRSNDYIGVQEFGGAVPRHQGSARTKKYSVIKPHASSGWSPAPEGYFLYPALRRKEKSGVILQVYEREVKKLCNRYMP